ncbi:hypothetical protein A5722_21830 [Mycobacterium vulneris]|nr:hypothetical protein A5722_21830 [Mycolicibacterium vulneris]OCB64907.1 hypothetical protein A5729_19395 [Mycolicibacterium vulneris]
MFGSRISSEGPVCGSSSVLVVVGIGSTVVVVVGIGSAVVVVVGIGSTVVVVVGTVGVSHGSASA